VVRNFLSVPRTLCGKSHFSLEFKLQAFRE
jgi:hypothetical protein